MTILLTGFEPFGGEALNSSWELARALHGETVGAQRIASACLPCRFASSLAALDAALRRHRPQLVLALGQAASRPLLSFERVAVNWVDARIPDNDGAQPIDQPVLAGAPPAYFSTLPIKAMARAVREAGMPAEISFSAGSFVCNQLFFGLQHRLRRRATVRSGFLHVPTLGSALDLDAMNLDTLCRATRAALAAAQRCTRDVADPGGRID